MLYPLTFTPILKYRVWGGTKLREILRKESIETSIGESWEISDVEGDQSVVNNGPLQGKSLHLLIREFKESLLGQKVYAKYQTEFPLLIKFIDAKLPLSVQVHPGDDLARRRHNSFGKNEMWYIMDAEKGAELVMGFSDNLNRESYLEAVQNQKIGSFLNQVPVVAGDTFYIPAGKVHAIGAGILLAEIQQSSDITYRIYDYDRIDQKTNQKRELHVNESVDAIDFDNVEGKPVPYELKENVSQPLVHSPFFKTNILKITDKTPREFHQIDSFVIYMNVGTNEAVFQYQEKDYRIERGETLLLPASISKVTIASKDTVLLEVFME